MSKLIGKTAICCDGRVGVIKAVRSNKSGTYVEGIGLDGKRWVSRKPYILNLRKETIKEGRMVV